jgi:hypothetical protein
MQIVPGVAEVNSKSSSQFGALVRLSGRITFF